MAWHEAAELCRAQITQEQVGFKLHSKGLKNHCRIQNIHKRLFWLPWRRDCGRDWSGWCKSRRKNNLEAKGPYSQSCGFSNSHIWMWELNHKESWAPKNWCFQTVVLEKTLESPLDSKEIKPINPKGNQPWIFIGRTDFETEAPIHWPPDAKSWLNGKDPDAGKDRRQEAKGRTKDRCWIAPPTQRTWVWASSRIWWRKGKPGMLQESQRVGHNWVTEQQEQKSSKQEMIMPWSRVGGYRDGREEDEFPQYSGGGMDRIHLITYMGLGRRMNQDLHPGYFLVVQWLRIPLPMQPGEGNGNPLQ